MKTAIIYYSLDGNCALVAKTLQEILVAPPFKGKAELFEIKLMDTKKRSGFSKFLWGVGQMLKRKKPALQPLLVDPAAYDLIVLGTPVWAASPAPALGSFLDSVTINGKKLALFCCHAGGKGKIMEKFKALLPGNTFMGEIDFVNPAGKRDPRQRAASSWLKELLAEWAKSLFSESTALP